MNCPDAVAMGLVNYVPDHKLVNGAGLTGYQSNYYADLKCSCGLVLYGQRNANGKASSRTLQSWQDHLNLASADTTEIYHIGKIKRSRGADVEVYVFPVTYQNIDIWLKPGGRYAKWIDTDKSTSSWYNWIIGTKIGKRHTIKRTFTSKNAAMDWARKFIAKEGDKGFEIEFSDENSLPSITPPALKANASILTILNRIDEAIEGKDVKVIEEVTNEVIDAIALLPILQSKKVELEERRTAILTRKFAGV